MEIDDKWQSAYGDLDFDAKKFRTPRVWSRSFTRWGWQTPG